MAIRNKDIAMIKTGEEIFFKGDTSHDFTYGKAYRVIGVFKDDGKILIFNDNNVVIKIGIEVGDNFVYQKKTDVYDWKALRYILAISLFFTIVLDLSVFKGFRLYSIFIFIGFYLILLSILILYNSLGHTGPNRKTSIRTRPSSSESEPQDVYCPKCGSRLLSK